MEIRLRKYQGFSNFPIQLPKTQGLGKLAHDFVSIKGQLVSPDWFLISMLNMDQYLHAGFDAV